MDEAITQFCAVTDASTEVARKFLQIADGNVEAAVSFFLEHGSEIVDEPTTRPTRSSNSPSGRSDDPISVDEEYARQLQQEQNQPDPVRAPIAARHDILTGGGSLYDQPSVWGGPSFTPSRHSIFNQGDSSSGSPGPDFMRNLQTLPPTSGESESSVSAKARRLADLFRPPFDIMYKGAFEEARAAARDGKKWLLINVQDQSEFACQVLNRDLWSDSIVKEILKESFIFLQYSCDSSEGKRYLTLYPIQKYPHVAIIDPRTGERVKVWEKDIKPTEFMMDVTEFLDTRSSEEVAPATPKKAKVAEVSDMSEEEQIRAAIQASLDGKASESPKEQKEEHAEEGEEEPQEEEGEEEEPQNDVLSTLQPVKRDEPTDLANSTRVQLRMADGTRIIRRFLKTDPVRYLFEFVKAEVPETQDRPFELVFNRKQLIECLDQSIQDAGLVNAAVNFVFP
ncbi:hypothetical protein BCR43DRAFT_377107 [Syncephalastrum racemosum]|uniref:UBX domain-containing protein n=1 Tax=Syncephalastrum racemosum TaxID=13706 RepID=A0A1X2H4W3_SYNRA|nr:hypothetical protein BCR43DRAFT_377107 [Syncephalastrum racemosum]